MKKFIFIERSFLNELYRNCPEHPLIAEILQKGEHIDIKATNYSRGLNLAKFNNLQVVDIVGVSKEEFGVICVRRKGK